MWLVEITSWDEIGHGPFAITRQFGFVFLYTRQAAWGILITVQGKIMAKKLYCYIKKSM